MALSKDTKKILVVAMADEKAANEISLAIDRAGIDDDSSFLLNSTLVQTIISGDTSHTPSSSAVYTALSGKASVINPITKMFYLDVDRADSYTPDGSESKPFKTIASALAQMVLNGDASVHPYSFLLSSGTYPEGINLNNLGAFNVSFNALGRVAIVPASGNSITANTAVSELQDLHFHDIEFGKPIVITGDGTASQFKMIEFINCSFVNLADITSTCVNNLSFWDIYSECKVTLSNTNYLYVGSGQIQDTFSMSMNAANTAPSQGIVGGAILSSLITNNVVLAVTGVGAGWNMSPHGCRMGIAGNPYTIPAGCNVSLYNSLFRGTWTNNGTLTLKNSNLETVSLGTAPVFTANKSKYMNYNAVTSSNWSGVPTNVNDAIDRLAAEVRVLKGSAIS
jgi:hypothetical protein